MAFCYYLYKNLITSAPLGSNRLLAGFAVDLLMYHLSHGGPSEGIATAWWDPKGAP